jgi:hypothetical protein
LGSHSNDSFQANPLETQSSDRGTCCNSPSLAASPFSGIHTGNCIHMIGTVPFSLILEQIRHLMPESTEANPCMFGSHCTGSWRSLTHEIRHQHTCPVLTDFTTSLESTAFNLREPETLYTLLDANRISHCYETLNQVPNSVRLYMFVMKAHEHAYCTISVPSRNQRTKTRSHSHKTRLVSGKMTFRVVLDSQTAVVVMYDPHTTCPWLDCNCFSVDSMWCQCLTTAW